MDKPQSKDSWLGLPAETYVREKLLGFFARRGFHVSSRQLAHLVETILRVMPQEESPIYLNRKEAALLLGVSLPTLDRYIRQEGMPFRVKNPRAKQRVHYIFVERDVLQWAESHLSGFRNRRCPK